jgi:NADH:ubiquinone oxidoreductase subunit E
VNAGDIAQPTVFDDETRRVADQIIAKYPNKRSAVLPLLFLAQSVEGHVTEAGMRAVGDLLDLTPAEVLAAASFYTMLKKRPQGDYLISICRNISCTHLGARRVIRAVEDHLGIEAGETTDDGKFSLETAECLATCDGAPALQINYEDFYGVTGDDVVSMIEGLRRGDALRSARGEKVKTAKEIAYETATAGVLIPSGPAETGRTIGGESPRVDTAPGFRPKERGAGA